MTPAEKLAMMLETAPDRPAQGFPCNLQGIRNKASLAPTAVAKAVGCHVNTLHNLELGRSLPNLRLAQQLAWFFGVTVNDIWPFTPPEGETNDPS